MLNFVGFLLKGQRKQMLRTNGTINTTTAIIVNLLLCKLITMALISVFAFPKFRKKFI